MLCYNMPATHQALTIKLYKGIPTIDDYEKLLAGITKTVMIKRYETDKQGRLHVHVSAYGTMFWKPWYNKTCQENSCHVNLQRLKTSEDVRKWNSYINKDVIVHENKIFKKVLVQEYMFQ